MHDFLSTKLPVLILAGAPLIVVAVACALSLVAR